MLSRKNLIDEAWRLRVENYAAGASRGKWIPFDWLVYVLRIVQAEILKGGARIIINAPPRHGKSEGVSHWLPTWFLDWFPDRNVILSSYADDFAADWGLKVRDEFSDNDLVWAKIRHEKKKINDWKLTDGGGMRTVGIGGSVTGRGGDLLIVDDPHKNWEEAMSPTFRRKVINWFNSTLYTRAEPDASIIVIQTRWHEDDLSGYLEREHEDDWMIIRLPAIAEENDALGREEGFSLCPERFTREQLERIKRALGSHMFAGLYQQRPAPIEGGIVKRDWFRRWKELPESFEKVIQSWDLGLSGKSSTASYVCGSIWGLSKAKFYLIDLVRERLNFPDTIRKILVMSRRHPAALNKYIENKAHGPGVIDVLEDELPGIIPYEPKGSKETRLVAVSGLIEAGDVYIPDESQATWTEDYLQELTTFPNSAQSDQVDTTTMALDNLVNATYNTDIVLTSAGARSNPWEFAHARIQ
jgi:predicted phage terminase large subunit-like protein